MKRNNYLFAFIFTLIFIIIEFSAIHIMLKKTRMFPKTEIVLKIEDDSIDDFELPAKISEESISKLQKAISCASLNNNQDKLLESFDKERNFYINFITIISIVLSIFGIAPVIYGIFEKNENAKLREELEDLKTEYGNRLDKIKQKSVFEWFSDKTHALNADFNFVFDDSTLVKNENDFYRFILLFFIQTINEIDTDMLDEPRIRFFAIEISNFMMAIIIYSKKRYGSQYKNIPNTNVYSIKENEIFNNLFINLQAVLPEEKFDGLIDALKSLPNKRFDYTGFIHSSESV